MDNKIHINKNSQLILLFSSSKNEWEDKTLSVTAMYRGGYRGNFAGYNIYFRGGNTKFFYKKENVRILDKIRDINIDKHDVYAGNVRLKATKLELFESGYYRVHEGGKMYVCRNIRLKSNRYKDILTYFIKLAEYAGTIAEENSPLSILSQQYNRFSSDLPNSVLIDYLQGEYKTVSHKGNEAILAFDFNQSQKAAIENALKSNISVIEGPPGTGKTQTILNLIASIVYHGKKCAVISNNNTAIDNVLEKLEEEQLAFITARLGNSTNVQQFFEGNNNDDLSQFLMTEVQPFTNKEKTRIHKLNAQTKIIQDIEVETALLDTELAGLLTEERHYADFSNEKNFLKEGLHSKHYLELMIRLGKPMKLGFLSRWLLGFKYRTKINETNIANLLLNAEKLYYKSRIVELNRKITKNREYLNSHNKELVREELRSLYKKLLQNKLHKHYEKLELNSFDAGSYKRHYKDFLSRYPVILSTSQSLVNNVPAQFMFDYLIIDEASQGDLLSTIPAMSCARNLVVVGDSRQLQQIEEELLIPKSVELSKTYDIPSIYHYGANSVLKSVKDAVRDAPVTLLREHYRCAPDIINFCNKMFYNGELVVMTQNQGKHIEIIKTVPGNHARKNPDGSGLYNQREIDAVADILKSTNAGSIGVITPFRHQANCIQALQNDSTVEADTIHKFQGRQKEEVILSFVVNSLDKAPEHVENRLYDFVTNNQLLNVAISRAKDKITAIVSDKVYHSSNNPVSDFIKYAEYMYGSDIIRESAITSVFDILYSDYTKLLISKFREVPKAHKTELLMCELIDDLLLEYQHVGYAMHTRLSSLVKVPDSFSEEERNYLLHPWTHVDYLFYNKVTKERLFVLEVDGIRYHEQNKKQKEHDEIKDRVLKLNNLPVCRFKTNESNERMRLNDILRTSYNL